MKNLTCFSQGSFSQKIKKRSFEKLSSDPIWTWTWIGAESDPDPGRGFGFIFYELINLKFCIWINNVIIFFTNIFSIIFTPIINKSYQK